jgi:hypothetical protein
LAQDGASMISGGYNNSSQNAASLPSKKFIQEDLQTGWINGCLCNMLMLQDGFVVACLLLSLYHVDL